MALRSLLENKVICAHASLDSGGCAIFQMRAHDGRCTRKQQTAAPSFIFEEKNWILDFRLLNKKINNKMI